MIRTSCVSIGLLCAVAAAIVPASAADIGRGAQLARQWCSNCHVIGGPAAAIVQQGPPSFRSIGLTADQLRTFLTHPHGAMPDLALSRTEIEDLIAYIQTLR